MPKVKQAVDIISKAEELRMLFENQDLTDNEKKEVLTNMEEVLTEMKEVVGIETSEKFADKFSSYYRYLSDTLIIEGH